MSGSNYKDHYIFKNGKFLLSFNTINSYTWYSKKKHHHN